MKKFILLFILVLSFQVYGEEKELCIVTSDIDNDYGKMVYVMDTDNREILHLYRDAYSNGKKTERVELKKEELLNGGIILNKKDKLVTLRMYSHNYDPERGGVLYLDTLYNGVSGERREYAIEVSMENKDGTTTPVMYKDHSWFNKMSFVAKRSRVLGVIGIERIDFSH